jgi:hypothetical protein
MNKHRIWFSLILLTLVFLALFARTEIVSAQSDPNTIYVANTSEQCTGRSQCFYNDPADSPNSIALNKAINFAKAKSLTAAKIYILSAYNIKTDTVTIDYPVTIIGESSGWLSTSSSVCNQPLLFITAQATLRNLYISDGNNCTSPSRDLIVVQSSSTVTIENSTLEFGRTAITHKNGLGNLVIRFSEIKNNDSHALFSENSETTSHLQMTANNIYNNGNSSQVICQNNSQVNHNYWGDGVSASDAAQNCNADNLRSLTVPIVSTSHGVQSTKLSLSSSYPSNDFYGFRAKSNLNAEIYVVNHGNKMPFPDMSLSQLTACSNYYDVFIQENSQPSDLTLRFSYAGNSACEQSIQSLSFCGSNSIANYPLMWLDPKTGVTAGWDNAGDKPQGPSAGGLYSGQEVRCNQGSKSIELILNDAGRPNLSNDLRFTPFVVGFEKTAVTSFRASKQSDGKTTVSWTTSSETNTSAFQVLRSETANGPWTAIGNPISAEGSQLNGKSYSIEDSSATGTSYYYQLQLIASDNQIQQTLGPIQPQIPTASQTPRPSATSRPTSTKIPTRTPTLFRTATNSFFPPIATNFLSSVTPTSDLLETETPVAETIERSETPTEALTPRTTYSGALLEKDKQEDERSEPILFIISGIIILFIIGIYLFFTKKKR